MDSARRFVVGGLLAFGAKKVLGINSAEAQTNNNENKLNKQSEFNDFFESVIAFAKDLGHELDANGELNLSIKDKYGEDLIIGFQKYGLPENPTQSGIGFTIFRMIEGKKYISRLHLSELNEKGFREVIEGDINITDKDGMQREGVYMKSGEIDRYFNPTINIIGKDLKTKKNSDKASKFVDEFMSKFLTLM